jgi:hypothetical protein
MPSLLDVQDAIRRSLLGPEDGAAAPLLVADGIAPEQRLAVYRNTYDSNLANALRLSYPAVHKLVGAEFFEGAARIFAHEHPPNASWLDAYGSEFPDFFASFPPAASLVYLGDVARLERAVNHALHAPDSQPLNASQLAGVDPAMHGRVCFVADSSITLLRTQYPADVIWRAVLVGDDAALSAVELTGGPICLIVERRLAGVEVTRMDEPVWQISNALFAGRALGIALASSDLTEATAVLAEHLAARRFVAFSLKGSATDSLPLEIAT